MNNPHTESDRLWPATWTRAPFVGAGFRSLSPERARVLLFVATRPAALALAVIVGAIVVTLLAARSDLGGLTSAVAAGWLVVHQVPLTIQGTTLGVLPLVPTVGVLAVAARECGRAVELPPNRVELAWVCGATVGGPLVVTAVCLAVVEADTAAAPRPPSPLAAFAWVFVLYAGAAAVGIGYRCRRRVTTLVPYAVVAAGRIAGQTLLRLLGGSCVVMVVVFLAHWSRIAQMYHGAGDLGGVIGLSVLSLLYVPNVLVGVLAVLVGASVHLGAVSVGLFSVTGGSVPALPILAVLPSGPAAAWWVVGLGLPAAVGALGGLDAARISDDRLRAPWVVLGSAGLLSVGCAVGAVVAGGALGRLGQVDMGLPQSALVALGWFAGFGYAGLAVGRLLLFPTGTPVLRHPDHYDTETGAESRSIFDDGHNTAVAELVDYRSGSQLGPGTGESGSLGAPASSVAVVEPPTASASRATGTPTDDPPAPDLETSSTGTPSTASETQSASESPQQPPPDPEATIPVEAELLAAPDPAPENPASTTCEPLDAEIVEPDPPAARRPPDPTGDPQTPDR